MEWRGLLEGEIRLTLSIALGLLLGMAIIRTELADRLMKRLLPYLGKVGIGPILGMAMTVSFGSAKTGAALLASALDSGRISERTAKLGVLMLTFPAHLRRWPQIMVMAAGMAGLPGAVFATAILLRSAVKFLLLLFILKNGENENCEQDVCRQDYEPASVKFDMKLLRALPLAWFFYAAAYMLVPWAENMMREHLLAGACLPLAALTVAAASIAHVSAALALAGGSLAVGDLTAAQAVFALLLGNSLGIVSRMARSNAGYYFGLFNGRLAKSMLIWNFVTTALLSLITVLIAAAPLFVWRY